jgi:excisionase family DNA binding protein
MTTTNHEAAILVRIPEAARRLGLGRTTLYATVLQPRGSVPVVKIGAASRVRVADLDAWAAEQAAAAREAGNGCP